MKPHRMGGGGFGLLLVVVALLVAVYYVATHAEQLGQQARDLVAGWLEGKSRETLETVAGWLGIPAAEARALSLPALRARIADEAGSYVRAGAVVAAGVLGPVAIVAGASWAAFHLVGLFVASATGAAPLLLAFALAAAGSVAGIGAFNAWMQRQGWTWEPPGGCRMDRGIMVCDEPAKVRPGADVGWSGGPVYA